MVATIVSEPVSKLYKRCKWGHHAACDGRFAFPDGRIYSVCNCQCHGSESREERIARTTAMINTWAADHPEIVAAARNEEVAAVAEAVALTTPKPKRPKTPQISNADTYKALGTTPLGAPSWGFKMLKVFSKAGPKNLRGGAKCVMSPMKPFITGNYGSPLKRQPTPFEASSDPHTLINEPFRPATYMPTGIDRCKGCNIVLHQNYGTHNGRCNHCNVKAGVMLYHEVPHSDTGAVEAKLIHPVTAQTFAAMLSTYRG